MVNEADHESCSMPTTNNDLVKRPDTLNDLKLSDKEDSLLDRIWDAVDFDDTEVSVPLPIARANIPNSKKTGDTELPFEGVTQEEFLAYWKDYDALMSEIGNEWLTSYMEKAFNAVDPHLHAANADDELLKALTLLHDDLVNEWVGSEDNPGVLTRILSAGMLAGHQSVLANRPANPDKVIKADLATDWTLQAKEAYEFAKNYAYKLIRGLDETTLKLIQKAVSDWIQSGDRLEMLKKALETIFKDKTRAALIAQTESTRAFNDGAEERWKQAGVSLARWQTVNDPLVCPECKALHGQEYDLAQGAWSEIKAVYVRPPAHPGCRCYSRPIVNG